MSNDETFIFRGGLVGPSYTDGVLSQGKSYTIIGTVAPDPNDRLAGTAPTVVGSAAGSTAGSLGSLGSAGSIATGSNAGSAAAKPFTSELDGEYTCEEVVYEISDRLIARVYGYKPDPNAPPPQIFMGNADQPMEGVNLAASSGSIPTGDINARIAAAAEAARAEPMSSRSGPDGGKVACAWAVNKVLERAGVPTLGSNPNLVDSLEQALQGGRGTKIEPRESGQPGDIVIMGKGSRAHVGIVIGPSKVVSNSSSLAQFSWVADYASYDRWYSTSYPCRVYRLTS